MTEQSESFKQACILIGKGPLWLLKHPFKTAFFAAGIFFLWLIISTGINPPGVGGDYNSVQSPAPVSNVDKRASETSARSTGVFQRVDDPAPSWAEFATLLTNREVTSLHMADSLYGIGRKIEARDRYSLACKSIIPRAVHLDSTAFGYLTIRPRNRQLLPFNRPSP